MSQVLKKWVADDAIDATKIKLLNDTYIRARNAADSADVNTMKLNGTNQIEFASDPYVGANKVQTAADKGAANGICPLDGSSKIASTYLPSYVDDVEEYANLAAFPVTGESGKIYVAIDTLKTYRWSGSAYVEISASDVNSVNGATGTVVLDADDLDYTQADTGDWTVADGSTIKETLDEVGSRLVTLEAVTASTPAYEVFTLNGTDITNQYVTLANTPIAGSIRSFPKGGPEAVLTDDFSVTGTQFDFAGDYATYLASGDKLIVQYLY